MNLTPLQIQELIERMDSESIRPRYLVECIAFGDSFGYSWHQSAKIPRKGFVIYGFHAQSMYDPPSSILFRVGLRAALPTSESEMDDCDPIFKYFRFSGGKPIHFTFPRCGVISYTGIVQLVIGSNLRIICEVNNTVSPETFGAVFGIVVAELPDSILDLLNI